MNFRIVIPELGYIDYLQAGSISEMISWCKGQFPVETAAKHRIIEQPFLVTIIFEGTHYEDSKGI